MKQILIFNRIRNPQPDSEFENLFGETASPIYVKHDEFELKIFEGRDFYNDKNKAIAKRIFEEINQSAAEALIIVHFNDFEGLVDELQTLRNESKWNIKQYSASDSEYETKIKPLFKSVTGDSPEIEKIYKFFNYDPILEAKHLLLQRIVRGEAQKGDKLADEISELQPAYDEFAENGTNVFDVIENQDDFNKFEKAYDKFYVALEIED